MLQKVIQAILNVFKFHKGKIGIILLSALVSGLFFFPYRDLGDLVTAKVAEMTGNQIYVTFDDLGLNAFPQPGLEMTNVSLETPFLPSLSADSLSVSPSITGLLSFKPGIAASASGLLGGSLSLSTRGGDKTEQGVRKQIVSVRTSRTNMSQLAKFAQLPLPMKGQLNFETNATIDPEFGEQPNGAVRMEISKFELVSANVPTAFGPLNLPQLALSNITLAGHLSEGRFIIEEGRLGSGKDELVGTVKGDVIMRIEKRGSQTSFSTGMYNFEIDFTVQPSLSQKATLFLSFLDSYKQPANGAARYAFRLSGTDFGLPPRITAIR